jgi:hypothetical protein
MPKQDVAVELYIDGAWHDIVPDEDVFADTPITIRRGNGAESAAPRPSSITLRLANDDDMYRTTNPESPLYGKAGRNTPTRTSVAGVVRGTVEASSWNADQTPDFRRTPPRGKAWVDIEGGGLTQRINQWTEKLKSPLTRQTSSYTSLLGLWPLEDPRESTILSQVVPGVASGTYSGTVTLGDQDERPGGALSTAQIGAGAVLRGTFAATTASGWQVLFAMRLPALPGSAAYEEVFSWQDSVGRRWTWELNNANYAWRVYDTDGVTLLVNVAASYSGTEPNQWVRFRMKVTVSGATVTYEPAWYVEGSDNVFGTTGTFAGTSTGRPTSWTAQAGTYNVGGWYTNVFAVDDTTLDVTGTAAAAQAFNGHLGERAGVRFGRLMDELGLAYTVVGDVDLTRRMGTQPSDTVPNILKEIQTTEDGLIFDDIDAIALVFLTLNARLNQTPALALIPTDLPALPKEVTDDLDPHNIVTAAQRDGAEYTARDDTGPLGTQPPPDGVGEYRQTVDVNIYDETDLPQVANWWLYRGTVNLPRFPQVTINLAALGPAKIAEVETVDVGSVITIDGYREYTIRLYVLGWTETIGTHTRTIVFTCAPDQQFNAGEYDDGIVRYDSASTTTGASYTPTATSIVFSTTDAGDLWWTGGTYDCICAGERFRVEAMGAASGSGPYTQPATVVRAVNGVRKTLPAGEPIHVATPGRYAL